MDIKLATRYRNTDTEELIKIAFVNKDDYQAEAVEIATKELLSRGITNKSETVFEKTQEQVKKTQEQVEELRVRDTTPFEKKDKVLFFILGVAGIVPLFLAIELCYITLQSKKRGKRKTKESFIWLSLGCCSVYALTFLLLFIFKKP